MGLHKGRPLILLLAAHHLGALLHQPCLLPHLPPARLRALYVRLQCRAAVDGFLERGDLRNDVVGGSEDAVCVCAGAASEGEVDTEDRFEGGFGAEEEQGEFERQYEGICEGGRRMMILEET